MPIDTQINLSTFFSLLLLGLLSVGHCLSMCGGISSGLALQSQKPKITIFCINLGRISSYSLMGMIAATIGNLNFLNTLGIQLYLLIIADLWLILLGLYLGSIASFKVTKLEIIAIPIWKVIQPLLMSILPIRNVWNAFIAGFFWGFIPCGLVYGVAITALSASSPLQGLLLLFTFGIGTLPNMVILGFFMNQLRRTFINIHVRRLSGLIIITMAISHLYRDITLLLH